MIAKNARTMRILSILLIAIGVVLLVVGTVYPMGILNIPDTTPPVWGTASDGTIALLPRDAQTYQRIDLIQAGVNDPEGGVASVTAWIDGVQYDLSLGIGTIYGGAWRKDCIGLWGSKCSNCGYVFPELPSEKYYPCPICGSLSRLILTIPGGTHTIKYIATNNAGLSTTYTGSFTIYTGLQGTWYVNNIEITSAMQVINTSSATITFKFVKTAGSADSSITALVKEGSTTLVTLANSAAGTWTGSYVFGYGTHTLSLVASDGTTMVTMDVFNINFGGNEISTQMVMPLVGVVFIVAGIGLYRLSPNEKPRRSVRRGFSG